MSSAESATRPALSAELLAGHEGFERALRTLREHGRAQCGGLWGSAQSLVLAGAVARTPGPWLALVSSEAEAEALCADLLVLGQPGEWLPAREPARRSRLAGADHAAVRARLQLAQRLAGPPEGRPRLIVASLLSALQPLPRAEALERSQLQLCVGERVSLEQVFTRLVEAGYQRTPLVERPGELSLRGDILDVFPFASELPLRVELFGDQVDGLRSFEPADQRSVETLQRALISLAKDAGDVGDGELALEALDPHTLLAEIEPLRVAEQSETLRIRSALHARGLLRLRAWCAERAQLALQSLPSKIVDFDCRSVQSLVAGVRSQREVLAQACLGGQRVVLLCLTEAERARTAELIESQGGAPAGLELAVGALAKGFRLPALALVVLNHRELVGADVGARATQAQRPAHRVKALESFFELRVGDLVVHAVHGLAVYRGLIALERNGGLEEHLHLVFADEVSLYVPASRIDLVQRYVGTGGQGSGAPPVDKIGGTTFRKRKEKVERALLDLAAELLEVQARRDLNQRPAWPADDALVRDMIAAFPYVDTPDQAQADKEIAADLQGKKALDRLLCGDVGFGKTEVAIRAAFRVVNGGAQVAVLVPTTVLAHQHGETFRERLAGFPVSIASLSRYTSARDAREAARRVAEGELDILIGTHRILSAQVQFKRLGLLIIDEEQRFGVAHKEHFKRMRASVDVLTLTATPIPRTLHMSLSGVRDISALSVPPEGRQEVETKLAYTDDDELVREVLLHERERGGQAFFLHNRVASIEATATRLRRLVPECRFDVGHGQMSGHELERVMHRFTAHETDVLVSTAIVENGIDIPAAGTILIDRADTFGLAELHQLRGRVGRGRHKSYCWLLVERNRPLSQIAKERLKALEEFSHLGAGFGISMKDLELRGAGNILGPEQSGHIAAIGYDMYCQLLKQTIGRMRRGEIAREPARKAGEPPAAPAALPAREAEEERGIELELGLRALLPEEYVPSPDARLRLLRQLRAVHAPEDVVAIARELRDRFGKPPAEALLLLRQAQLVPALEQRGLQRVSWRQDLYLLEYSDRIALERWLAEARAAGGASAAERVELRVLRAGLAHLVLPKRCHSAEQALAWLERSLQLDPQALKMAAEAPRT